MEEEWEEVTEEEWEGWEGTEEGEHTFLFVGGGGGAVLCRVQLRSR